MTCRLAGEYTQGVKVRLPVRGFSLVNHCLGRTLFPLKVSVKALQKRKTCSLRRGGSRWRAGKAVYACLSLCLGDRCLSRVLCFVNSRLMDCLIYWTHMYWAVLFFKNRENVVLNLTMPLSPSFIPPTQDSCLSVLLSCPALCTVISRQGAACPLLTTFEVSPEEWCHSWILPSSSWVSGDMEKKLRLKKSSRFRVIW